MSNLGNDTYMYCNGIVIHNNVVTLSDGTVLPKCPTDIKCVSVIDGRVFIDGYEFKRGKWRKTLRALFAKIR